MGAPLILYSTNSWLAFAIAENYYRGVHYVWCSPFYNPRDSLNSAAMPPSSIPGMICLNMHRDVTAGDLHSALIARNKVGVLAGAKAKREAGVITDYQEQEITSVVDRATVNDFRPIVYVIPFAAVAAVAAEVPAAERAHPLAIEYRIRELPRSCFDVIDLWRM